MLYTHSHAHAHTYTRTQAKTWLRLCLLLFPFAEQQRFRFLRSIRDVGVVFFFWCIFFFFFFFWSRLVNATTWSALAQANLAHAHRLSDEQMRICSHTRTHVHTHVHAQTHERWNCTKYLKTRRARPVTSLLCARLPLPNNTNIERELTRRFASSVGQKVAQPHAIASARALRAFREVSRHESDGTLAPNGHGAN